MESSDSEQEAERFREAIDTSLFTDRMFNDTIQECKPLKLKSNRQISTDHQVRDISVSSNMQNIIGNKISTIIESTIEFVNNIDCSNNDQNSNQESGVKLFSDSSSFICDEFPKMDDYPKTRVKIKKRRCENDLIVDKKDAIIAASVSPEFILDKNNTKHWKSRRKNKIYKYIKDKNKLTLIE